MTKHVLCYLLIVSLIKVGTIKAGHRHIPTTNIVKKRCVLKTKLLLHNRKLYLIYGMVLCLVTLTDL